MGLSSFPLLTPGVLSLAQRPVKLLSGTGAPGRPYATRYSRFEPEMPHNPVPDSKTGVAPYWTGNQEVQGGGDTNIIVS